MPKYEDYQIKTINKILKNYFPSDENTWPVRRMLVSDEVGLGKTYVAKGLIRAMAYRYLRDYDEDKLPEENNYPVEFRVLYLCSNLNIANQNKVKLGLDDLVEQSGDVVDIENRSKNNREYKENASENRTSMLYLQVLRNRTKSISFKELYNEYVKATGDTEEKYDEEKENRSLKIIVLPVTPNTSIKVKDAGWTQEREYILRMIEVCNIVEGFDYNYYRSIFELDIPISNKYEKLFESVSLKDSPEICRFKQCLEKYTEEITQILGKKEKLKVEEWEKLRVIFSLATLDVFVYNLAILDEFQNFHTIISGASEAARKRDYERKRKIFIYHFLKSVVPEHPLVEQYKKIEGFQSEIEKDENRISDYFENSNIKELCQSNTDKISNMSEEDLESRVEEIIKNNDFEIHIDNNRKDLGVHKSLFDDLCKIMNNNGPIIIEQEENRKNDCQENQEIVNAHLNELCKKLKNKTENKKKKYNPNLQYFLSAEDWLFYSIAYLSADNMERLYCKIRELRDKDCYEIFKGERWEKHPYIEIANWIKNTEFLNNNEKKIMSMNLYFVYLRKRNKQNAEEQITRMKEYYHTVFRYNNGNFGQAQNNYDKIELFRLYPEKQNQKVDYDNPEQDIIDKIFGEEENEDMRILLLSATPFKMYMGKEIPGGDVTDEKKETIKEVCDFLQRGGELSESLNKYKSTLIQFSKTSELSIPEELKRCKTDFLNKMGKCFTRMERGAVLRELMQQQAYILDTKKCRDTEDTMSSEEIVSYDYDGLNAYINELLEIMDSSNRREMVRQAMKVPYALSFMIGGNNGYNLKKELDSKEMISQSVKYSLINKADWDDIGEHLGNFHGVFDKVEKIILNDDLDKPKLPGAEILLWIPPVTCREKLKEPFRRLSDYGKTILFSAWTPVPRAISILISDEVEKRLKRRIASNLGDCKQDYTKLKSEIELLDKNGEKLKEELKKYLNQQEDDAQSVIESIEKMICNAVINCLKWHHKDETIDNNDFKQETIWFIEKIFLEESNGLLILDSLYRKETDCINLECIVGWIKQYCEEMFLQETIEEYLYMQFSTEDDVTVSKIKQLFVDAFALGNNGFIKKSKMKITIIENERTKDKECDTYFARGIGASNDDDKINTIKNLQNAFNSPFAPFVFSTTSMGQEGLDFHFYADRIVHWNLPSNPVDFEQREGRINRRDCLAIRKEVVKYIENLSDDSSRSVHEIFESCFEAARRECIPDGASPLVKCGMIPHWLLPKKDESGNITGAVHIKRYVPYFGGSQMLEAYNHNLKVLQLYRSVIGQPNPDELLVRLLGKDNVEEILKEIYLDFSPYYEEKQ